MANMTTEEYNNFVASMSGLPTGVNNSGTWGDPIGLILIGILGIMILYIAVR